MANIFDVLLSATTEGNAHAWNLPNERGEGRERWIGSRDNSKLENYCKKHDVAGTGTFFCVSTIEPGQPRKKEFARQLPFLFCDIDFKHIDLTPEEILERLLALPYPPSRVHNSGNGFHCFWFLSVPVGMDGFERAEALLKRIAYLVGGDIQVCHCVALLRVPGTTNSKRDERKLVKVIRETSATYDLDHLERWLTSASVPVIAKRGVETNPFLQVADSQVSRAPVDVQQRLRDMRVSGGDINGVHPSHLAITASLTSRDMDEDEIVEILLDATKALDGTEGWNWIVEERAIRGMCRDMRRKLDAKKREPKALSSDVVSLKNAKDNGSHKPKAAGSRPTWRGQSKSGEPRNTLHNARVALNILNVTCRHDVFQNRIWMGYDGEATHELQQVVGEVSDDAIIALRRIASDEFDANFTDQVMLDAVRSIALEHQYNPVRDELDAAESGWDGQERLDRMAVDYVNAADTPLNRAFIRKTMIAAVRRVRHPGVKYDTITVLESPEGWNKSGFWRVLAGDEYYSDQSIMGQQAREVQEQLSTVWIHENAELAGMRKTDVEVVKAYASRQVDIARPAYGRVVRRQPRHSIDVATTNNTNYLRSQTGNRRFWPIKVLAPIDMEKLRRDRLQLLGEAAKYESSGEEITLATELWRDAAIEQDARRVQDAWEDVLADMPTHAVEDQFGHIETFTLAEGQREEADYIKIVYQEDGLEKVASATVIRYVLQMRHDRLPENVAMRLSAVMKHVGWQRPDNKISIAGKQVRGYVRPLPGATSDGAEGT
jgi:predicted P-loop ATPase